MWAVTVPPVVFQCRLQKFRASPMASQCGADSTKFLQWHSSVGLFQLNFLVNQWHSSGIPVYTGAASVHWLRVRDVTTLTDDKQ